MINVEQFIQEWITNEDIQYAFETPYQYALYMCGGDFSLFDDVSKLITFFNEYRPEPAALQEVQYDDFEDLPY